MPASRRHMIEPVGDDDAHPTGFDHLRVTAVAGLLEQEKGLFHRFFRQSGADGCMRFADASTEMRSNMQDLHSAATLVNSRVPPGASTVGLTGTNFLNLSSNTRR